MWAHHDPVIAKVQMDERLKHAQHPILVERLLIALIAFLFRLSDGAGTMSSKPHQEQPARGPEVNFRRRC